ncbi:MAG: DNA-binding protein [Oscillospiraceae bacterium]|jgi:predicted DNA-binding protein YlxM (UPF0122 family)|nr:DNA-binding protein [Oscillospiraceae bacterium]
MAKNLDMSRLLDFYGGELTAKQREVASLYFNDDYSLSEIAEMLSITRQGVRDHIRKVETALKDFEECLCMAKNHSRLQERCQQLNQMIDTVKQYNAKYLFSAEVTKRLKEMTELLNKLIAEQSGESI